MLDDFFEELGLFGSFRLFHQTFVHLVSDRDSISRRYYQSQAEPCRPWRPLAADVTMSSTKNWGRLTVSEVIKNIAASEQVMYTDLAGGAVLLNLANGQYYGLDETGARMWALLIEHGGVEPAYQALLQEYEVDDERLRQDLLKLVDELSAKGLLKVAI
jgi:hypothetical protein